MAIAYATPAENLNIFEGSLNMRRSSNFEWFCSLLLAKLRLFLFYALNSIDPS